MRRIGVDVGGTNTDAVLLDDRQVRRKYKTPTTDDITSGVTTAIREVLLGENRPTVAAVMIGTTHFTNAVVERRGLTSVAAVRIGLPASRSLPPFVDWPDEVARIANGGTYQVAGGHEYDGRPIVPFDSKAMRDAAERIADSGVRAAAVSSVFSPLNSECEQAAREILGEVAPAVRVTTSHDLGRIGLLERENAAILNAALFDLASQAVAAFHGSVGEAGLSCPLHITLNDGTVASAETVARFPVLSFASGPTNSMRGAAFLSGLTDALVVDVGGTTTDVGCLVEGFPRQANGVVEVGGVRTLFRMPDLLSIGLGGGSVVSPDGTQVGPESVGHEIVSRARVFGGDTVTATGVGAWKRWAEIGVRSTLEAESRERMEKAAGVIHARVTEAVDRMKTDARPETLIAVGGAAFLVPDKMDGVSQVVRTPHEEVANAVGAAIAQVSGEVDRIFHGIPREEAIAEAVEIARTRAVDAGADAGSLETVDVEDLPLAYLPGNALRVRAKVVGEVAGLLGASGHAGQ